MGEMRAEPLSPIDTATLWPQLGRLNTEVIATRGAESLLVSSGLAATGLSHLPRVPRTSVLGVRRGLSYRGVAVGRELAGGAAWEAVSLRLSRPKDDDTVTTLCEGLSAEVASRGGRTVYMRYAEGSLHADALRKGGFFAYRLEHLYAVRGGRPLPETAFRPAARSDRHGIFRLYCRAVPEMVRRHEAPTQQDWRAVLDSFDCDRGFVLDGPNGLAAWVGIGDRESHVLIDNPDDAAVQATLDLVEAQGSRNGTLVIAEHQFMIEAAANERGYTALGTRLMCARRLALSNPLKEVATASVAESVALPH